MLRRGEFGLHGRKGPQGVREPYPAITVFDAAGKPHLWSSDGLPLEQQKFPTISRAVSRLKLRSTVLDGETVAIGESGIPRFQLLHLGALLLGAYRNGKLQYYGNSGSGFSETGLRDALDRMKPLFTNNSPFENPPRVPERMVSRI